MSSSVTVGCGASSCQPRRSCSSLLLQIHLVVAQVERVVVALGLDGLFLLALRGLQLAEGLAQAAGVRRFVHAHAAGGLVHQVDGLVGQEAIGDVARRQPRRRVQRLVGDAQLVVLLVGRTHALEDLDRLFDGRLFHQDRLEAPLQRRVAFDVLAILVQRRRADALQLAARQRRLQDVGRVHAAAGRAGADQHVHLVDEQDGVGVGDFFDDLLEALFELAAIHRARHQRADVEQQHALVDQRLGHVAVDDALRQPLDDGRLADARLADQRRVVLGAAAENLDHALDLLLAADHRIELAFLGARGQIEAQLIGQRRLALLLLGGLFLRLILQDRLVGLRAHLIQADAQAAQHFGRDALAFLHQAQQQMLGADVRVAHLPRLFDGQLDHVLGARGQASACRTAGAGCAGPSARRRG